MKKRKTYTSYTFYNTAFFILYSFLTESKLSCNASLTEIFDAMKHPVTGVNFISKVQSLPSLTFVLWDAITWLQTHIEGNINPLETLEAMRK